MLLLYSSSSGARFGLSVSQEELPLQPAPVQNFQVKSDAVQVHTAKGPRVTPPDCCRRGKRDRRTLVATNEKYQGKHRSAECGREKKKKLLPLLCDQLPRLTRLQLVHRTMHRVTSRMDGDGSTTIKGRIKYIHERIACLLTWGASCPRPPQAVLGRRTRHHCLSRRR